VKKLYSFLLFIPFAATAQKSVDLDKFHFKVQYRSLPAMRIDSTYRTYHVTVESTKLMTPFLQDLSPEKSVRIEGWRKLAQDGHLSVKIKLGDLLPGDVAIKERVVTTKNRSGVITGTKTFYSQEVTYTFEAEAAITDHKGIHIMDQQMASRNNKRIYRSPEFAIRTLAEGYFVLNSLAITKELYRENVNNAMHSLSESLTNNFGFDEVTASDFMWVIDSRKHPQYNAWRTAFQQMNDVLFNMTANKPIAGAREVLKPSIEYFEKIKKTYASSSRHDRKIRYGCYYNLAVLYYYLDDPQAMAKEASGLILNDFDPKDGKAFENTASWLRNLFEQTNIYTRHFAIDINSLKGPNETGNATASANKPE
jgi:hypothetical protein